MSKKAGIIFFVLFLCGCSSVPFKRVSYVPLADRDPAKLREDFARKWPQRFEVTNSSVFGYRWMKFSSFGPLRVDTLKKSFTVAGLNPLGVKLFELDFANGTVDARYVFPELAKHGDFAKASGEDIKNIYLDCLPPPDSKVIVGQYRIVFRAPVPDGFLDYVFAGEDNLLIEKHFYKNNHKLWSVFYYEYVFRGGKVIPAEIIFRHHAHHYILTVKLKEIIKIE
ncbi:MAG: hypothetical protein WC552_01305 [Candidatus Omnitrophota bacterium]